MTTRNVPALRQLGAWLFNSGDLYSGLDQAHGRRLDYPRLGLFLLFHLAALTVIQTGVSPAAILVAVGSYLLRMFFITAFYHRYFSHRSYQTGRIQSLLMAIAGCTAGQRGPLWWASHHRHHHLTADTERDVHSPLRGLLDSHLLWIFRKANFAVRDGHIRDFARYPELRWLESLHWLPFIGYGLLMYLFGQYLASAYPGLGTNGAQLFVWGFIISTICLYHATYTINSLAHRFGSRRYEIRDDSRNHFLLALLTLGEGWHNNHHRYPVSARQGFYWWELDITWLILRALALMGLVRNLRPVPDDILAEGRSV